MPPHYPVQVIEIRLASATDAPAIARVNRESWRAAYEGIIAPPVIGRATAAAPRNVISPPPYRRTLVAVGGDPPAVVGYASYGPERTVASPVPPGARTRSGDRPARAGFHPGSAGDDHPLSASASAANPLTPAGQAGQVGEVYAIYVTPAWWSTGTGRALMDSVLSALEAGRYRRAVLWVLADNTRARRFYERAGFAPDGGTNVLIGLGGVLEVRYTRDLLPPAPRTPPARGPRPPASAG